MAHEQERRGRGEYSAPGCGLVGWWIEEGCGLGGEVEDRVWYSRYEKSENGNERKAC